jgi:hypothetical protein
MYSYIVYIELEGFETKEQGRETVRKALRPGSSYEDVKQRLLERKRLEELETQKESSDIDIEQFQAKTNANLSKPDSFQVKIRVKQPSSE